MVFGSRFLLTKASLTHGSWPQSNEDPFSCQAWGNLGKLIKPGLHSIRQKDDLFVPCRDPSRQPIELLADCRSRHEEALMPRLSYSFLAKINMLKCTSFLTVAFPFQR
jgi:hypothetical protein